MLARVSLRWIYTILFILFTGLTSPLRHTALIYLCLREDMHRQTTGSTHDDDGYEQFIYSPYDTAPIYPSLSSENPTYISHIDNQQQDLLQIDVSSSCLKRGMNDLD